MIAKFNRTLVIAAAFAAATVAAAGAQAAPATQIYGEAVQGGAPDRSVTVTPSTRYVNVDDGQTVRFNASGKTFEWHFDTLGGSPNFDLSAIAPKDVDVSGVRVYVDQNPLYRN
jgi:hypothetical protein